MTQYAIQHYHALFHISSENKHSHYCVQQTPVFACTNHLIVIEQIRRTAQSFEIQIGAAVLRHRHGVKYIITILFSELIYFIFYFIYLLIGIGKVSSLWVQ